MWWLYPLQRDWPRYDTKLYLMLGLQFWWSGEYSFITISPRSSLPWSDNICLGSICGLNKSVRLGIFDMTLKKNITKDNTKYVNMNIELMWFPNL